LILCALLWVSSRVAPLSGLPYSACTLMVWQHHVASTCPHAGPTLHSAPDVRLSLLIDVDDTAILADSAEEMQQLLTSVDGWCCSRGMTISTALKSEATVFNCRQPAQSVNVSVQGKPIPVCKVSKYLGVWFHHINGAAHNRGKFAVACLHRKLYDLEVGSSVTLLASHCCGV
jgi:hypothetical protein